jgi:hypothetical protein
MVRTPEAKVIKLDIFVIEAAAKISQFQRSMSMDLVYYLKLRMGIHSIKHGKCRYKVLHPCSLSHIKNEFL